MTANRRRPKLKAEDLGSSVADMSRAQTSRIKYFPVPGSQTPSHRQSWQAWHLIWHGITSQVYDSALCCGAFRDGAEFTVVEDLARGT